MSGRALLSRFTFPLREEMPGDDVGYGSSLLAITKIISCLQLLREESIR
jgi:hypothetical protein